MRPLYPSTWANSLGYTAYCTSYNYLIIVQLLSNYHPSIILIILFLIFNTIIDPNHPSFSLSSDHGPMMMCITIMSTIDLIWRLSNNHCSPIVYNDSWILDPIIVDQLSSCLVLTLSLNIWLRGQGCPAPGVVGTGTPPASHRCGRRWRSNLRWPRSVLSCSSVERISLTKNGWTWMTGGKKWAFHSYVKLR